MSIEHAMPEMMQLASEHGDVVDLSTGFDSYDRTSLRSSFGTTIRPRASTPREHASPVRSGANFIHTMGGAKARSSPAIRRSAPVAPQMRLAISSPGDAAELEAHSVGKQIVRMAEPAEAAEVRHVDAAPHRVFRRAAGHASVQPETSVELDRAQSTAEPLPPRLRFFMEVRFGADFDGVRIHADDRAASLCGQLGAQAFTIGRDIYFGKNQFQPDTPAGRELIAHELTHTIQQRGAVPRPAKPAAPEPPKSRAHHAPEVAPPKPVAPAVAPQKPAAPVVAAPKPVAPAEAAKAHVPAVAPAAPHPPATAPPKADAHTAEPPKVHPAVAEVAKPQAPVAAPAPAHAPPAAAPPKTDAHTAEPAKAHSAVAEAAKPQAPVAAPAPAHAPPAAHVGARAPISVQRFGLSDAWNYFADKANLIPGFRMLTIILGVNPLTMAPVDRSPANILRAVIEFIPGGGLIVQALDNSGVFDKVGAWVSDQIATLNMTGAGLKDAVTTFLGTLSWSDIFDLGGVWDRAKKIFSDPIDKLIAFVKNLVVGILKFIKDAILLPLAKLAEGTRGWDLLIAVLGKNPITGEAVPRNAETLIGGFLKLIGQDEIWENMKKSNAISRAWAWFQSAMAALVGFVSQIPDLFVQAFKSLTIEDVVLVAGAFQKVASVFGGFIGRFIDWAGTAMWNLLEIIFDVVSPGALTYIKKTGSALKAILQNPLPFVGNLVKAAKLGFQNFADHFGEHLKSGLIDWLTGSLPGIYIPKAISLVEIGKFVLSILGITWAQIRAKIVKALGPNGEKIMTALETTFDVVVALVKGGPAAAWDVIKDKLSDLKDQVMQALIGFVEDTIVSKAVPKLISLFVPGAGFISAIISIYDTIKVFIEKLAKIVAAVKAFVDSIVAIAAGQIEGAAAKVESTLAGLLSLAINFLASFIGLGSIADKVMGVIKKVQATVDKALDTAITWIITKAKALFAKLFGGKDDTRTDQQKAADLQTAISTAEGYLSAPDATEDSVRGKLPPLKAKYKLTALDLVVDTQTADSITLHIHGEASPGVDGPKKTIAAGLVGDLGMTRKSLSLSFTSDTKAALISQFENKYKTEFIGFKEGGLDIRHHVSISDTINNINTSFKPKTFQDAADALVGIAAKVPGGGQLNLTSANIAKNKSGIIAAARQVLQAANNDLNNLFIGDLHLNRSLRQHYDPGDPSASATAPKFDPQKSQFIYTWGVPGSIFELSVIVDDGSDLELWEVPL